MSISSTSTTTNAQQKFDIFTIDRMTYVLRYNIEIYLQLYEYFVQNNLQAIINYYTDSVANPDKESFDFLADMITESNKIKILITLNKNSFTQIDDWELLDFIESIAGKLDTFNNTAKWTRSSSTQNAWRGAVTQTTYTLGDDQTLEDVSQIVYGGNTNQDDWMRIAVENDLGETDYQVKGGNQINLTKRNSSSPNYFLNSIIDNLVGVKLYGLDINQKLGFTNNDLNVLSYNDTVIQSVLILVSVKKGDNPEFNSLGLDPALAVGATFGSLKFSSLIRQLQQVFNTDDSLRNFNVTNVSYDNGALYISYQVDTFYDLTYSNKTSIQQV